MLRRRSAWQISDAEEEVSQKIGDAEEEVDFPIARKINGLKPIFRLSSFLTPFNLLRVQTLKKRSRVSSREPERSRGSVFPSPIKGPGLRS
jgi:hypothetical protein